jgi:Pvc16 N-terminal domain
VFISHVDFGLERLLRTRLPLPEDVGDVSFDAPSGTWSAQLSRITVNLFLYDVQRSTQPSVAHLRPGDAGRPSERRRPQPMIQLDYLVSAWAGSPRDEHQLLGDVVSLLSGLETIPADLLPDELSSTVRLTLGGGVSQPREIWSAAGGSLKASMNLQATVAADTFDWEVQAPAVERIDALASRMDDREHV